MHVLHNKRLMLPNSSSAQIDADRNSTVACARAAAQRLGQANEDDQTSNLYAWLLGLESSLRSTIAVNGAFVPTVRSCQHAES
jgi:hypothetical protein